MPWGVLDTHMGPANMTPDLWEIFALLYRWLGDEEDILRYVRWHQMYIWWMQSVWHAVEQLQGCCTFDFGKQSYFTSRTPGTAPRWLGTPAHLLQGIWDTFQGKARVHFKEHKQVGSGFWFTIASWEGEEGEEISLLDQELCSLFPGRHTDVTGSKQGLFWGRDLCIHLLGL